MTLREGLGLLAGMTGIEEAPRFLPAPLGARRCPACSRQSPGCRHKPTRFCREMVRTLIEGSPYDGTQATRDLELVYTPIEDTMRRTIRWYLEQGLITRPLPTFNG